MRAAIKSSQRAKTKEENCSTPRVLWPQNLYTTESTPKSSQLLLQAIQWTTSRSPVYFCCLHNRMKSLWKNRHVLKKPMFWQLSAKNPWQNFARSRNLHQNSLLYRLPSLLLVSRDTHHFEAPWTRYTLDGAEIYWKTQFFAGNFRKKSCGKITKLSAKN